ncbi:DUF6691 family protein [Aliiroseovarius sp.]|uniref:DUF6691 family protein n=1 Tax=Aliiroseovarius sp. TaxID=1872442 RepID=UPI00263556AD|nr:DUF6691 family protein [Aliiroseovarius sp.]
MKHLILYFAGLLFGFGISMSGMGNPAKVLNFFDVAGTWDPSLILVMGGALVTTFIGYRVVLKRPAPAFDAAFHLPTSRVIDARLIGGSAVFGIGWGVTGFCPGGVLPVLSTGAPSVLLFTGAMIGGMFAARALIQARANRNPGVAGPNV